jgi:hypothetical protein
MVWFVHKIEHIIRNYTRWWLDQRIDNEETIEQLCSEFSLNTDVFSELHVIFNHATSHIEKSIESHRDDA